MADASVYCLGVQLLGECSYKPASPYAIYFSLGEAISALAVTVAIQQLLKPVFHLRLAVRSLTVYHLYAALFAGAAAVLFSAVVPQIPALHNGPWGFPVVWEVIGALIFAIVYGTVVWVVAHPAVATSRSILAFCQGSGRLLSSASDTDRVDYVRDLAASIPALIEASAFIDRPPHSVTAFWQFTHRKKIERGVLTWQLLRLLADPLFCKVAVRRVPWVVAHIINDIASAKHSTRAAQQFVQEIAFQAVFDDESMMVREVAYTGFGTVPVLSDSIFRSIHVVTKLDPFGWYFSVGRQFTPSSLKRFGKAFEAATETLIDAKTLDHVRAMDSCLSTFERLAYLCDEIQQEKSRDHSLAYEVARCFESAAKFAGRIQASCPAHSYRELFATDTRKDDNSIEVFGILVDVVYKGLEGAASRFAGVGDPFWTMSHSIFSIVYGRFSNQPSGLTPLQQRLMIKMLKTVRDNMNGYYPIITRVMLAVIGPYNEPTRQENRSPFNILRDAFYAELKSLRVLAVRAPNKVAEFLPPNVTYDAGRDVLIHTYSGGSVAETDMRSLSQLVPLDLAHPANLHFGQPPVDGRW